MVKPVLIVGNRNYSSWSLRPYMALKMADIPFDEKLIRFGEPAFGKAIKKYGVAGRVPILMVNGRAIWDSLAILEYAAELRPELWPRNKVARHVARSMSAEMHAGFQDLRNACPMNIRRAPRAVQLSAAAMTDIKRIDLLWRNCRKEFGKGGPFLFGKFSNADAMFAPIASRFETFAIKVSKPSADYAKALLQTKAFQMWKEAALKEPWIFAPDEVD